MLLPTLTRRVEHALQALDSASPIFQVLEALDPIYEQIETYLLEIAEGGGSKIQDNASSIHSQLASIPNVTKSLSARKLFREVEHLEQRISAALGEGVDEPKHIVEFLGGLDDFAEAYNIFVAHQTGINALPLLLSARRLRRSLESLRWFLEYIKVNSSSLLKHREDESEFSLILINISSLEDFAEKLAALHALYAELCYVLGVSVASHPLRIGNIQSGSLWTRLFGDTRVIGLMISLVEGSVQFLHRNYTNEGKIAAIPKKIESLDAILDFSNRLKNNGVDVAALQSSLAKSAASITDSLNTLVSNQPIVEVNGKVLSVAHELQQQLLEQIATPKISYQPPATPAPRLNPPE